MRPIEPTRARWTDAVRDCYSLTFTITRVESERRLQCDRPVIWRTRQAVVKAVAVRIDREFVTHTKQK